MTIEEQLSEIVAEMQRGDFRPARTAALITEDEDTGIMTIISMSTEGVDTDHHAFCRMAKLLGFARVA